jgi:hypothetical protein
MLALAVAIQMVVVALLTGVTPSPDAERHRLGIITSSVVLEQRGADYVGVVKFRIEGPTEMQLDIDTLDVWVDESGARITLPPGSTPFTADGRLNISSDATKYLPEEGPKILTLSLRSPAASIDQRPLVTGVRLTLRSDNPASTPEELGLVSAALALVYAAPPGGSLDGSEFRPDVIVEDIGVTNAGAASTSGPLRSFFFVNGGPVTAFLDTRNRGTLFAFATHSIRIDRMTWGTLRGGDDNVVFESMSGESVLLPGQSKRDIADVVGRIVGTERDIDVIQQWGLYRVTGTVSYTTGNASMQPIIAERSTHFLVFPFRQTLLFILVTAVVILAVLNIRGRRRAEPLPAKTLDTPL